MRPHKTKNERVNLALREYIQWCKQQRIVELFGAIDYDARYNYKAESRGQTPVSVLVDTSIWSLPLRRRMKSLDPIQRSRVARTH